MVDAPSGAPGRSWSERLRYLAGASAAGAPLRALVRGLAHRFAGTPNVERAAAQCRKAGMTVDWTVDPSAWIGDAVHWSGWGHATSVVEIGARSIIEDGASIRLKGGSRLVIGPDVLVRRGAVLNIGGTLRLDGDNLISWYSVIHAGQSVVFETMAGTGEMVTVVNGDHRRADADNHWYKTSVSAPVVIGRNTWLAAKSTVTRGVTIGRNVTVAANSVVRSDVPDAMIVAGAPARIVGPSVPARTDAGVPSPDPRSD